MPALSLRGTGRKAARAVIEALALLRGRKHLDTVRTLLSAPAALRRRSQQIRRRCVAARGHAAFLRSARAGGVAPQACRPLAFGKAGKGTAKPPARTCTILSIKRGPSRRCVAARAKSPSCVPQGRGVAPQACRLLACGKAERAQQSHRRGRVLSFRSSAALSRRSVARRDSGGHSAAGVLFPLDQARRSAAAPRRESLSGSTRREETAEALRRESPRAGTHPLKKGPFAGSFFAC